MNDRLTDDFDLTKPGLQAEGSSADELQSGISPVEGHPTGGPTTPDTRYPMPGTRNLQPETRNLKPATRNLKPETRYLIPLNELRKFIWIFFSVGIFGMGLPWTRVLFIRLVPLNFIVCLFILGLSDQTRNRRLYWVSGLIFLTGWLVEAIGVNTGVLFGQYGYSLHMGPALFGTPLVMGLSWLIMLYLTVTVVQGFTMHPFYRTVLAAVLMVVFDFLLEPAAIWMKMWFWEGGRVPVFNYMMWFLVSLALASLFPLLKIRIRNHVARTLYVAQMVFFILLIGISFIETLIKG